ncbi:MAG: glycoside hydrolase family 3 C-terminal domain-containing protein, partial [Candidatus Bathyarchaeota archaeon]|nr:glycoside hydrolase family 3 C-terminal domain-containing protein [Candidatus Bathyarchaeota archaeon]
QDLANFTNAVQRFGVEETRLGIPVLFYMDAVHGHASVNGATVFPHNLGLAASWDSDLVVKVATVTAREARATGIHLNFSPICDVAREPRWGRTFETFGEVPYLCSVMSAAKVGGYQGRDLTRIDQDHVVATAKHFPAYSCPERGQDASPVDISEYTFRTVHLPSFQAAIKAGAWAVMPCYNEINGKPVHGSKEYLTDLLRGELGFKGIVVSDAGGIEMLCDNHHTAETYEDAVRQGVEAGIDIAIFAGSRHATALLNLVENGRISEEKIDESVRRILEAKFRLGLFESPYVDPGRASKLVGSSEHRELALLAARKSMTLLKNEGNVLPLPKDIGTVLVTGPNADNVENQLGGWSKNFPPPPPAVTVLEGIRGRVSAKTEVLYTPGSGMVEPENLEEARELAERSDVAIVVVGESAYIHEFWTFRDIMSLAIPKKEDQETVRKRLLARLEEFPCRTILDLPQAQLDLIKAVHETGTPTVAVLITGRPLTIRWVAENVRAILMAYLPGTEGGNAVADVLFGDYNPGGKSPISIARSIGQLPVRHDYKPHPFASMHPPAYAPLFEFGFGLSYTRFKYSHLEVQPKSVGPKDKVEVSVAVENVGDLAGDEVVQLYVNDVYSSRVTPLKELKGFKRVTLKPGESRTVTFTLKAEDLGVFQDDGRFVTEPGTFQVMIGGLESGFEVTG